MKLITDYDHCEFIPETDKEKDIIKDLYESFHQEDKETKIFGADIVNLSESGCLYIITYI